MKVIQHAQRTSLRAVGALAVAAVLLLSPTFTGCDTVTDGAPSVMTATTQNGGASDARWGGPDTPPLAEVAVMSQNLYLGGPIFRLIEDPSCAPTETSPLPLLLCVDQVYSQILASDFAARAESIADEIARVRPALVGLQEVSTYYLQSPSDPATPATDVSLDFLDLLLTALADRGLAYVSVSENLNVDLELPAFDGQLPYDVRYQDEDVVLALQDSDVATGETEEVTFTTLYPFSIAGVQQTLGRGYQTVEATVDGFSFTFVNTHLEIAEIAPVRDAQAAELAAAVDVVEGPAVLVGDLNATSSESNSAPYAVLTESLNDVFARPNLRAQPTCCQAADLRNEESILDKRIDYVLFRGFDRVRAAETVLDEPGDRVVSEGELLWPSDHAGVAALLIQNLRRVRPNA